MILDQEIQVEGKRCFLDGFRGTIRFVGRVPPTEGLWYGVEWDEERGKHDGTSKNGTRYFKCSPNHGSFVRPHKVLLGYDDVKALKNSYGDGGFDEEANKIILHKETTQETFIELVGFDRLAKKQCNFESLREVDLSGTLLCRSCESTSLATVAPNIRELVLRKTLISSLRDIVKIAGKLNRLEKLDISENILSNLSISNEELEDTFPNLVSLSANKMNLGWKDVLEILVVSKGFKELFLCYNNINEIRNESLLKNLVLLNLEGNHLNWDDVMQISTLTRIERLILNNNKIDWLDTTQGEEVFFPNLKALSLIDNNISSFDYINKLDRFPSLTDIRFKGNPVNKDISAFTAREELIARIEKLKHCNGSAVSEKERKTAELDYRTRYADEYYSATEKMDIFESKHPRYKRFISTYGPPDKPNNTGTSLKRNLLSLRFKCPDCKDKAEIQKNVPATITVQQLKGIIQRQLKVPHMKQKLTYTDKNSDLEISLDDNMKQLHYYAVATGDTILVRWE